MKTTQQPTRRLQIGRATHRLVPQKATIPSLDYLEGGAASGQARSFLNLSHEYDRQARSNFAKEAFLFGIIIVVALAWPVVQGMRALPF